MSQIDQLIYFPLLTWFCIFLFLFYILNFVLYIPLTYHLLQMRLFYFLSKLNMNFKWSLGKKKYILKFIYSLKK